MKLKIGSLLLLTAACSSSKGSSFFTSLPNSEKKAMQKHSRLMGVGAVELEKNAKADRGASLGSFAYPVKYNENDYFVGVLGGGVGAGIGAGCC